MRAMRLLLGTAGALGATVAIASIITAFGLGALLLAVGLAY